MLGRVLKRSIETWDQRVFRSPSVGVVFALLYSGYLVVTERFNLLIRILPCIVIIILLFGTVVYHLLQETAPGKKQVIVRISLGIRTLPLRKYFVFIALVITPIIIVGYIMNREPEGGKVNPSAVRQSMIRKEAQLMSSKPLYEQLVKFTQEEFLENLAELRGYIDSRKKAPKLNPDKLVSLLNTYFRALLLYPSPELRGFYLMSEGNLYKVEFSGHNAEGERKSVSLAEMSNTLIAQVCSDLLSTGGTQHLISFVELFTRALITSGIDTNHKYNILNAENTVLRERFNDAIRMMPETKAKEVIQVREGLILGELHALDKEANAPDPEKDIKKKSLIDIFCKYIRCEIDLLIANNNFVGIYQLLYGKISATHDRQILSFLLERLVTYNNLFLLERKEEVRERITTHRSVIGNERYDQIIEMLKFSPDQIDIRDFSFEPVEADKQNIRLKNVDYRKARTVISFVIRYKSQKDYSKFEYPGKYSVEFRTERGDVRDFLTF